MSTERSDDVHDLASLAKYPVSGRPPIMVVVGFAPISVRARVRESMRAIDEGGEEKSMA